MSVRAPSAGPGGRTLTPLLVEACRETGQRVLFADAANRLTGSEVLAHARSFATHLRDIGVRKGSVVAFLCGSSARHAVAFLGCQVLGAVVCCLHTRDGTQRLARTLAFIDADVLVADAAHVATARDLASGRRVVSLDDDALFLDTDDREVGVSHAPDDVALILLSSGTTGDPKCIVHTQSSLAATASMGQAIYGTASPSDRVIVIMAPSFAAWIHTVLPFVTAGSRIRFDDRFEPAAFLQTVQDEAISVVPLVPTAWRRVLAESLQDYDLSAVTCAFFSGEPGSASLVSALADSVCPNVVTAYLASEGGNAAGVAAGPEILNDFPAAAGRSVAGGAVRIVDPDGAIDAEVPRGTLGEILVRGASLSTGYLHNPDLTSGRFVEGWWRSGDVGYLNQQGILFVCGRTDNRINTGGIKVYAEEIEAALLQHPRVRLAAVVGETDERWGQRIEAHVVTQGSLSSQDLLNYLEINGLLPRHLLPKAVHFHEHLPTGPTGKLYRRGLRS